MEDGRVVNKEYKLHITSIDVHDPDSSDGIVGSVKCLDLNDVEIVCNNLIGLAESNKTKINKGSFIGIHYCNQIEEDKLVLPCTLTKLWSK
jgi:hypothetical protein